MNMSHLEERPIVDAFLPREREKSLRQWLARVAPVMRNQGSRESLDHLASI